MSLNVLHLNADTTFLLIFSADPNANTPSSQGKFSMLIDPWLCGDSIINKQLSWGTRHIVTPSVGHLSEIAEPDLVLISQDQPDHCHEETMRQLQSGRQTIIAAEPKAAKLIKKWNHFDRARVFAMPKYDPRKKNSVLRFRLPALAAGGSPGEVTVAYLPQKNDLGGLHNGFGITYQAPTSTNSLAKLHEVTLPEQSPFYDQAQCTQNQPPQRSKIIMQTAESIASATSSETRPSHIRPISILYTPHGLPPASILPYIRHHLLPLSAVPLTLLLHSFSRLSLPWYFGGNILSGASNGVLVAKTLMAQVWLGAHDEVKENMGFWKQRLKSEERSVDEVRKMMRELTQGSGGMEVVERGMGHCDIRELAVGESAVVSAEGSISWEEQEKLCAALGNWLDVVHDFKD